MQLESVNGYIHGCSDTRYTQLYTYTVNIIMTICVHGISSRMHYYTFTRKSSDLKKNNNKN